MLELKGKPVAEFIYSEILKQVAMWPEKKWKTPHLAVVLVGDDPASQVYVSHKQKACENLKYQSTLIRLSVSSSQEEVAKTLQKLNHDESVDAILLQLPLPNQLDSKKLTELIRPDKDADGLTQASLGALISGQQTVASCTPAGIMQILQYYKIGLVGKKVVVIGRSLIVGLPLFHLLIQAQATVTVCHSKTENMNEIISQADIIFVAIGKPRFFKAADFKKNATVIDVGIHRTEKGLCGDVDFSTGKGHLFAATPVPGGVGPMTIAMLMKNTMTLAGLHRTSKS